jgi:hypothetical protein
MKFLKSSKEKIWKERSIFQCSISLLIERKMDASRSSLPILLPMIQVPVSSIALQVSVKKIIRSVFPRESSTPMTHQYQLMKTENSPKNVQYLKEFMSKMLTKSSSRILKTEEELFKAVLKSTTILSVGEVTHP